MYITPILANLLGRRVTIRLFDSNKAIGVASVAVLCALVGSPEQAQAQIYPATEGLSQRALRSMIYRLLQELDTEPIEPLLPENLKNGDRGEAIRAIHFPETWQSLNAAREHLVEHLGQKQRIDDVPPQLDLLDVVRFFGRRRRHGGIPPCAGSRRYSSERPLDLPYLRQLQGFAVSLQVEDPADAERRFKALADGGTVTMPFGKTFFSKGFGMGIDQFGIPWMVNSPLEGH